MPTLSIIEEGGRTSDSTNKSLDMSKSGKSSNLSVDLSTDATSTGKYSVVVPDIETLKEQLDTLEEGGDVRDKQKVLCCGSCCDVRRACIIIDCIYISFMIWVFIWNYFGLFGSEKGELGFTIVGNTAIDDDDYVVEEESGGWFNTDVLLKTTYWQIGFGFFFSLVSIVGSIKFWWIPVLAMTIWLWIDAILFFCWINWISAITVLLYSYPHFAYFWALKRGHLTAENYIPHCCCANGNDEEEE